MTSGSNIAKNLSALFSSQLLTWALTIALTIVAANTLGPQGLGSLQVAISVWALAGVLITFGTDTLLIKGIARSRETLAPLVGSAIALRLVLFIGSCALVAGYVVLQRPARLVIELVLLLGAAQLLMQIGQVANAALQGLELMVYTALNDVVMKSLNTVLGITAVLLGYGAHGLASVTIICALVALLLQYTLLLRAARPAIVAHLRFEPAMLRAGLPYLASGLSLTAYGQIDTLVIAAVVNTEIVGYYTVAIQLFATLLFLPSILTIAVFPALSRNFAQDPQANVRLVRKSFDLMLLISVPVGLGIMMVASRVVPLIYGTRFIPSGPVLALLGVVLIFTYQNVLLGRYFASIDRPNVWTVLLVLATLATIGLDLWLVPLFQAQYGNGALGGGVSYLITEATMLVAGLILLPRGTLARGNLFVALRVLLAGGALVGACWLTQGWPLPIEIAAGALAYGTLIWLLRVLSHEDWQTISQLGTALLRRVRRTPAPEPTQ
jgi:O-antigen/teichoic acid export membrane protein